MLFLGTTPAFHLSRLERVILVFGSDEWHMLEVFCLRCAISLVECCLTKPHHFRRHTVMNYLQVITDGYIKSTESISCHSAIAWPEYLLPFIYFMPILYHGQVRILRHVKNHFC